MALMRENKELIFSYLSGYNFYRISEHAKGNTTGFAKIRAYHELNGTEVEIREDNLLTPEETLSKWKYFIEHPVDSTNILWPIDIVQENNGKFGLVFRRRAFPPLEKFKTILYDERTLDWKEERIQKLICNLLEVCSALHKGGYAYHCFDIERLYYNPQDMSVLFDFSPSMARTYYELNREEYIRKEDVGIEFLAPWLEPFEDNNMTLADDYYSITAILFRLMIGRMPYQGRVMDGAGDMMNRLRDVDLNSHNQMFKHYLSNPVFIFDKEDNRNKIGLFSNEQMFIERWEALPEQIQAMFEETLCYKNVKQVKEKRKSYSPEVWLEKLNDEVFQFNKE